LKKTILSLLAITGALTYLNISHLNKLEAFEVVPKVEPKTSLKIMAVGDIMMASTYPNTSRMPPQEGVTVLANVYELLKSGDVTFGNLEGPLIDGGVSSKCRPGSTQCFAFRTPVSYAQYLAKSGFDVMSLANNHAGDFGEEGRESTRLALEKFAIKHAGSGVDQQAETIIEKNGQKIGFIAFGHNPGMLNINDLPTAKKRVAELATKADIVIVSFHGGAEGTSHALVPNGNESFLGEQRGDLKAFSRAVIDSGADMVLGHGPHILRGMEIYNDRIIAYSMGNFATYGWFQLSGGTALTAVFEVDLNPDGSFKSGKIHPHKLVNRGIPLSDPSLAAIKEIQSLSTRNFPQTAPLIDSKGIITSK
jgi:Bacterial capsule synthesis protein PGA_cap